MASDKTDGGDKPTLFRRLFGRKDEPAQGTPAPAADDQSAAPAETPAPAPEPIAEAVVEAPRRVLGGGLRPAAGARRGGCETILVDAPEERARPLLLLDRDGHQRHLHQAQA